MIRLLPSSYFPSITYFSKVLADDEIVLDQHEHFIRQTLRNRCLIAGPNGIQKLVIPVKHTNGLPFSMKEVRISNEQSWQRQHWRSLSAAYNRSAFFEFYQDDFYPFYHTKFEFLIDFNTELINMVIQCLGIKISVNYSEKYYPENDPSIQDYRYLSEQEKVAEFTQKAYPQVFSGKFGFIPGLSIADLLFNAGNASLNYLVTEPLP
jgi:hypothetical protein